MRDEHTLSRMYVLLHANMQQIVPLPGAYDDMCYEWMSAWKRRIRDEDIRHVIVQEGDRLRGFMLYSVDERVGTISIDEMQIEAESRGNGVTFRRLLAKFLSEIERIPCDTVLTYANKRNPFSPELVLKMGFTVCGETERGWRYRIGKAELLERLRRIQLDTSRG